MQESEQRCERVLISGASGYIGRRLVEAARAGGLEVVAAVREPRRATRRPGVSIVRFDLTRPDGIGPTLAGVSTVIHLAAIIAENSQPPGVREDLNISGTRSLLQAARRHGVRRFIFVSSQSAAPDAPSRYGRSKWVIEQMLTERGDVILVPGMVTGGPPRGLYGVLLRILKRLPVVPIVRPGAPLYPVHVDDLCALLVTLAGSAPLPASRAYAAPRDPITFASYLRLLARKRLGRRILLLPLPGPLVLAGCRLTEVLPFLPTVSRERVIGLIALRPLQRLHSENEELLKLRPLEVTLAAEGRRRRLLMEGRILTRYILRGHPPGGVIRRYARAITASDDADPLDLPASVHAWPAVLRFVEPLPRGGEDLWRARLGTAARIAEATPVAAPIFHNYARRSVPAVAASLLWVLAVEASLLPIRWLRGRWKARGRS